MLLAKKLRSITEEAGHGDLINESRELTFIVIMQKGKGVAAVQGFRLGSSYV